MRNTAVILYRDDGTLLNAIERKHGALSVARHAEELSEALGAAHTGIARALILCADDQAMSATICSSLAASGVKTIAVSGGYAAIPGLWRIEPGADMARVLEEIDAIIAQPEVLAPAGHGARVLASSAASAPGVTHSVEPTMPVPAQSSSEPTAAHVPLGGGYAPAAGGYGFDIAATAQTPVQNQATAQQATAQQKASASSTPRVGRPAVNRAVLTYNAPNQPVPVQTIVPQPAVTQPAPAQRAQNTPKPQAAGVATDAPGSKAQSAPLLMTAPIKLPAEAPAASLSPKITVQSATGIPNLPPPARASQIPAVQVPVHAPGAVQNATGSAPSAALSPQGTTQEPAPQAVTGGAPNSASAVPLSTASDKSKRSKRASKAPKSSRKHKTHNMGLDILRPAAPSPEDYREQNPSKGSVITIWGTEGAPGRSTVAINLAAHAAKCGHRVCVIDADTYAPSLSALLYMEHEHAGLSQLCRAAERGLLDEHALARAAQRIPVSTFHFDLISGVVQAERWHEVRESAFRAVLEYLRLYYEVIIVDIAPSIEHEDNGFDMPAPRRNGAAIVALEEAAQVLLLGVANPIGVPRAVRAWQRLHSSGHNISPTVDCSVWLTKMHADISRFSAKDEIRRAWSAFSGEDAPEPQFIGYDHRALSKAIERGQLVMQAAPRSRFARDMEAMYKSLSLVHYS